MTRLIYIFLLTGVFAVMELLFRNFGLFFPFCALFIFYIAVAFGNTWGFAAICLAALALDLPGSGAAHPWSILVFLPVLFLASGWLRRAEADSVMMNFLPGLIIPVVVWILSAFFFSGHFGHVLVEQFPVLFPACAFSALWLPFLIFLLDNLNAKLSLPLFTDAKLNQKLKLK